MDRGRVWAVLFVGVSLGATVFSTLQARQPADRAAFQSLQITLPVTDIGRSVEFYRTVLESAARLYFHGPRWVSLLLHWQGRPCSAAPITTTRAHSSSSVS